MFLPKKLTRFILSLNDDKRMQSVDLIETYVYRTSKNLVSEKEQIKCNNIRFTIYNDTIADILSNETINSNNN